MQERSTPQSLGTSRSYRHIGLVTSPQDLLRRRLPCCSYLLHSPPQDNTQKGTEVCTPDRLRKAFGDDILHLTAAQDSPNQESTVNMFSLKNSASFLINTNSNQSSQPYHISKNICQLCKTGEHSVFHCKIILQARLHKLKNYRLCTNCLPNSHTFSSTVPPIL